MSKAIPVIYHIERKKHMNPDLYIGIVSLTVATQAVDLARYAEHAV